jgi:hypothetical protein
MAAAAGRLNRPPAPQEGRHALARKIFHGRAGQLYRHYQEGMEDQIGALGLVLNALVLFNTRYMDADVVQLCAEGFDVQDTCSPVRASGKRPVPPSSRCRSGPFRPTAGSPALRG